MPRNPAGALAIAILLLSATASRRRRRRRMASGMWRGTGTVTASCPATAHPSRSRLTRRGIPTGCGGMAAHASIAGAGTAADSARAGPRRRSGMCGTAADRGIAIKAILRRRSELRRRRLSRTVEACGQRKSLADRDAADAPAVAGLDALPNRIANARVAVIGPVSAIAVIGVKAEPESAAAETATVKAAAAKAVTATRARAPTWWTLPTAAPTRRSG